MGKPLPAYATVKSPTALSRFLNHAPWSMTAMIRIMRHHARSQLKAYRNRCVGRPPRLELIVDLTSIAKEGRFEGLGDWMHTLNSVHGVHRLAATRLIERKHIGESTELSAPSIKRRSNIRQRLARSGGHFGMRRYNAALAKAPYPVSCILTSHPARSAPPRGGPPPAL